MCRGKSRQIVAMVAMFQSSQSHLVNVLQLHWLFYACCLPSSFAFAHSQSPTLNSDPQQLFSSKCICRSHSSIRASWESCLSHSLNCFINTFAATFKLLAVNVFVYPADIPNISWVYNTRHISISFVMQLTGSRVYPARWRNLNFG